MAVADEQQNFRVLCLLIEPLFKVRSILTVVHYGVHVHILKEKNKAAGG